MKDVSIDELKFSLDGTRNTTATGDTNSAEQFAHKQTEKVLKTIWRLKSSESSAPEHLLLSILRDEDSISSQILSSLT
jgi:ATP-dependent Clp protease ATP-binding subunit ClpC